jgi:hypothetical protein
MRHLETPLVERCLDLRRRRQSPKLS